MLTQESKMHPDVYVVLNWEKRLQIATDKDNMDNLCSPAQSQIKLYKEKLPKLAAIHYATAIKFNPQNLKIPRIHFQLGQTFEECYYAKEMYGLKKKDTKAGVSEEENSLQKAHQKYLETWELDLHVGHLLLLQEKSKEAMQHLQTALALKPSHPALSVALMVAKAPTMCVGQGQVTQHLEKVLLDAHFASIKLLLEQENIVKQAWMTKRFQALSALIQLSCIDTCRELLDLQLKLFFYRSQPLRENWRTHVSSPVLGVAPVKRNGKSLAFQLSPSKSKQECSTKHTKPAAPLEEEYYISIRPGALNLKLLD
ncbi:hypothetical protein Q7C36_008196 [Tachysurus vachellii]|uniref:Uncharacterized protein n=1 Tax=Tachysurus vachellii TaxID=175792 RepID=A0AA88NG03_TACVA|nr:hypothetical protein Q7C36_008196 [Tachysurus vachellii]